MHGDSKILINYLPQERPPILKGARFQMHWDSKILINYPLQESIPILWGQFSNASLEGDN